jgi:hypothetical protein
MSGPSTASVYWVLSSGTNSVRLETNSRVVLQMSKREEAVDEVVQEMAAQLPPGDPMRHEMELASLSLQEPEIGLFNS